MSTFKEGDIVRRTKEPYRGGELGTEARLIEPVDRNWRVRKLGSNLTVTWNPDYFELVPEGPTLEEIRAEWDRLIGHAPRYGTNPIAQFHRFLNPEPPKPPTAEEIVGNVITVWGLNGKRNGAVEVLISDALREAGLLRED